VITAKLMSDSNVTVLHLIGALESQIEALKLQVAILRDIGSRGGFEISPDAPPARAVAPPAARKPPEPVRTAEAPRQTQQAGAQKTSQIDNAKAMMIKIWFYERGEPLTFKEVIERSVKAGYSQGTAKNYFTSLADNGLIERDHGWDEEGIKSWQASVAGDEFLNKNQPGRMR
jgi:hypothetical protein